MKWLITCLALLGFTGLAFAQPGLTYAEWFIDQDPGLGNANPLPVSGARDTIDWAIDLSPFSEGVHYLFTRVRDSDGKWSTTHTRSFLQLAADELPATQSLAYAEWYINQDPGLGNGNPLPIEETQDTASWMIDLTALDPGVHYLSIRTRDSGGRWSTTYTRSFLKAPAPEDPIASIDYSYTSIADTFSFSIPVDPPSFQVELDFDLSLDVLTPNLDYELCFSAITVSGQQSDPRCYAVEAIVTQLERIPDAHLFRAYPNPATDFIQLELKGPGSSPKSVRVFSQAGQTLSQHVWPSTNSSMELPVAGLVPGMYVLVLDFGHTLSIKSFIKR